MKPKPVLSIVCSLGAVVLIFFAYQFMERKSKNRGQKPKAHIVYWLGVTALLVATHFSSVVYVLATYFFDRLTMTCVATVFPVYESLYAICTIEEDDDKKWLQYWITGGIIFMGSSCIDQYMSHKENVVYWYEFMTFVFMWLFLPNLQGAALIYDHVTEPYIAPLVAPYASKMNHWMLRVYQLVMNAAHLWIVWVIFMFLPASFKHLIAVVVGTVYPWVSSIMAATTEEIDDDTYWLTYWSCYGLLFLIMEFVGNWIGWIPGFYTVIIFATIYLMLPMFEGSNKIFREILVPIAGLQEMLLLQDAIKIKNEMLKKLSPERAKLVRTSIAKFYAADNDDNNNNEGDNNTSSTYNPEALKEEFLTEYKGLHGRISNLFQRKTSNTTNNDTPSSSSETTNLV